MPESYKYPGTYEQFKQLDESDQRKYFAMPNGIPVSWMDDDENRFKGKDPTSLATADFYETLVQKAWSNFDASDVGKQRKSEKASVASAQQGCIQDWPAALESFKRELAQVKTTIIRSIGTDFRASAAAKFPFVKAGSNSDWYWQNQDDGSNRHVDAFKRELPVGGSNPRFDYHVIFDGAGHTPHVKSIKSRRLFDVNSKEHWLHFAKAQIVASDQNKLPMPNIPSALEDVEDDNGGAYQAYVQHSLQESREYVDISVDATHPNSNNALKSTGKWLTESYPTGWATALGVFLELCNRVATKTSSEANLKTAKAFLGIYSILGPGIEANTQVHTVGESYQVEYSYSDVAGLDLEFDLNSAVGHLDAPFEMVQPTEFNYYTNSANVYGDWDAATYRNLQVGNAKDQKSNHSLDLQTLTYRLRRAQEATAKIPSSKLDSSSKSKVVAALKAAQTLKASLDKLDRLATCIVAAEVADALLDAQIMSDFNASTDFEVPMSWDENTFGKHLAEVLGRNYETLSSTLGGEETFSEVAAERIDRRRILVKEQCFLMNYVDIFAEKKKLSDTGRPRTRAARPDIPVDKRLPYITYKENVPQTKWAQDGADKNASILLSGDPYAFMNRLVLSKDLQSLFDVTNAQLSLLQPKIRLYKVIFDENGDDMYEVEVPFETNTTQEGLANFTADKGMRGVGVGLKDFIFSYEGSNPFAVKKSIKGRLRIFANSMAELLMPRRTSKMGSDVRDQEFRYVDLALKTGRTGAQARARRQFDFHRENIELSELNFRLKAHVGWAIPSDAGVGGESGAIITEELRNALKASYVTLNLTPTVHTFDFDDIGRVTFNIDYLAYVEQFFDTQMFNIFANAKDKDGSLFALERLARRTAIDEVTSKCSEDAAAMEGALKQDFKKHVDRTNAQSVSYLTKQLVQAGKMKYINLQRDDVIRMRKMHLEPSRQRIVRSAVAQAANVRLRLDGSLTGEGITEAELQAVEDAVTNAATNQDPNLDELERNKKSVADALLGSATGNQLVAYFYVGDLVDLILANIDTELTELSQGDAIKNSLKLIDLAEFGGQDMTERVSDETLQDLKKNYQNALLNYKKMRIILGPVETRQTIQSTDNSARSKSAYVNFADIPISIKYFYEFLTEKMLSKQENFYSLTKFLNDFFNVLVKEVLNGKDCAGTSLKNRQHIRVTEATLTAFGPTRSNNADPVTQAIMSLNTNRTNINRLGSPVLSVSGPDGSVRTRIPWKNEYNYFVFSAAQTTPLSRMRGNANEDRDMGIYHYVLGRDRGLIRNIKLTKTQTKGLQEVRFEQHGYDGLQQLHVVYDVQIDTYAFVHAYPGTYLFVEPRGFAPGTPAFSQDANILDLTKLGIGGYYLVKRSEHSFGAGQAHTTIHAQWVHSVHQDSDSIIRSGQNTGTGDKTNVVCTTYLENRNAAAEQTD